jgi:hypothetical protein
MIKHWCLYRKETCTTTRTKSKNKEQAPWHSVSSKGPRCVSYKFWWLVMAFSDLIDIGLISRCVSLTIDLFSCPSIYVPLTHWILGFLAMPKCLSLPQLKERNRIKPYQRAKNPKFPAMPLDTECNASASIVPSSNNPSKPNLSMSSFPHGTFSTKWSHAIDWHVRSG